ncbi:hypothetical protein B0T14DRAFT_512422 [Immersiella caudata]|uniref:Heterokaryon incompatibility domain-containing protein n=1 Tax=Immersiella caudata TaxID=314043 RepID=A0AA39X4U0_9PEZI|nr:hypothetical protein B0T14DRAFT_512422 [Immersiella caudata]
MLGLYTPLNHPQKEIRLLTLAPPGASNPSHTLTIHPLAVAPPFTALSYVWGSPTNTNPITINNATIPITETLATALHNLSKNPHHHAPLGRRDMHQPILPPRANPPSANHARDLLPRLQCHRVSQS